MKIFLLKEDQVKEIQKINGISENVDFEAFKVKDTVNPIVFDESGLMRPAIRKSLIQTAKDYYEYLEIEGVKIIDIILAGSMANYNWSDYSDVDVHLLIKFSDIGEDEEILDNMMWALKEKWNLDHDIKIKQYKVEMYTQNLEADDLESNGIYSIVKNKWLRKPKKQKISIDQGEIQKIVDEYESRLTDLLIRAKKGGQCDGLVEDFDELIEDFFDMRKEALKSGGEFSTGNLAFKALRREDYIERLMKGRNETYDYTLSISPEGNDLKDKEEAIRDKKTTIARGNNSSGGGNDEDVKNYQYKINGKKFNSLRSASTELGIPHTTIQYRVNSDNSQWSAYQKI